MTLDFGGEAPDVADILKDGQGPCWHSPDLKRVVKAFSGRKGPSADRVTLYFGGGALDVVGGHLERWSRSSLALS